MRYIPIFLALLACSGPSNGAGMGRLRDPGHDTLAIKNALAGAGYELVEVLDEVEDRFAAVTASRDGNVFFLALMRSSGEYRILGRDRMLEDVGPSETHWFTIAPDTYAVSYSHNFPTEGLLGLMVYAVAGDSLRPLFMEGEAVCRPSTIADIDGNGVLEIVNYSESLSGTDCSHQCSLELEDRFQHGGHWVTLRAIRGSANVSADHPSFYRAMVDYYAGIIQWLDSDEAGAVGCGSTDARWLAGSRGSLQDWLERARALAADS